MRGDSVWAIAILRDDSSDSQYIVWTLLGKS